MLADGTRKKNRNRTRKREYKNQLMKTKKREIKKRKEVNLIIETK